MKLKEKLGNLAFDLFKIIVGTALIGSVMKDTFERNELFVLGLTMAMLFLIIGIILNK